MHISVRGMLFSLCIFCLYLGGQPSKLWANATATIAYLEQLLAEGKKVAILCVDMQTGYTDNFLYPEEFSRVFNEQVKLLDHFANDPRVYFIDVNNTDRGPTLSNILERLKKKTSSYRLFEKDFYDVFENADGDLSEGSEKIVGVKINKYLQSHNVTDIHVMGCFDDVCVKSTVEGGLMENYKVSVDSSMNITNTLPGTEEAVKIKEEWEELEKKYPHLTRITSSSEPPCSSP